MPYFQDNRSFTRSFLQHLMMLWVRQTQLCRGCTMCQHIYHRRVLLMLKAMECPVIPSKTFSSSTQRLVKLLIASRIGHAPMLQIFARLSIACIYVPLVLWFFFLKMFWDLLPHGQTSHLCWMLIMCIFLFAVNSPSSLLLELCYSLSFSAFVSLSSSFKLLDLINYQLLRLLLDMLLTLFK